MTALCLNILTLLQKDTNLLLSLTCTFHIELYIHLKMTSLAIPYNYFKSNNLSHGDDAI